MSAGDRDTLAELRRLMHEHRWVSGRDSTDSYCICGWRQSPLDTRYPNHLADVLLASDWLTEVKAGAWDEGFRAGYGRDGAADNPYRTTENTGS